MEENKTLSKTTKNKKLAKSNASEITKRKTIINKRNDDSLIKSINPQLLTSNYPYKQWTIQDLGDLRNDLLIAHYDKDKEKSIIWANGPQDKFNQPVSFKQIEIKSRVEKDNVEQASRSKDNAEVYTPYWICNLQNDLVDQDWFKKDIFAYGLAITFKTVAKAKKWHEYVKLNRMEITCGEAPYLVSRYDVTKETKLIHPDRRTGLLDRKLRVINTFAQNNQKLKLSEDEWHKYAKEAYQSIYGFEYQGDSLFLARCNLLLTYIDYWQEYFHEDFDLTNENNKNKLKEIARIICWNIWQMDGMTNCIPSKEIKEVKSKNLKKDNPLQGTFTFMENNNQTDNEEKYKFKNDECWTFDWSVNNPISFIQLLNSK